jgi:hypothetical protein
MSNRDYFDKLRKTETYKESLITQLTPWWLRPFSSPKASQQQRILAIKMRGSEPNLYATLTDNSPGLSLGERVINNLRYVFVEMRQKTLEVPPVLYDFEDVHKHQVEVTTTLEYRVVDAKTLIKDGLDAIKELRQLVSETIQSYLGNIGSGSVGLAFLKESMEVHLRQTVSDTGQELGIEVEQVSVKIELSQGQVEHYKEKRDRIKNVAGLLEAIKVSGVSLKTIIEKLDFRLMLNFYNLPWEKAMEKLQARLDDIIEGKDYERKIKLLKGIQTDEMCIEKVRMNIAHTINASLSTAPGIHDISAFASQIQSLPQSPSALPKTVGDDQISKDTNNDNGKEESTIVDVKDSDTIELKRQFGTYQKTWGEILVANELLEAIRISGTSLKTIIENLDIRLMLNFYYLPWEKAMDKLQARLDDIVEGRDYERKIRILKSIETDEMYVEKVRMSIADIVNASLSTISGTYHNTSTFVSQTQSLPQPQGPLPEVIDDDYVVESVSESDVSEEA